VLEAVRTLCPDVVLLTASLADGPLSGLGALRQIRETAPEIKTVILLNGPERNLVVDSFRAGARGVLVMSSSSFKSLCRCVEQVHAGQIWASSNELSEVMEAFVQLAPMRVVNSEGMRLLTKREEDVVRLLAEGMQNRDIAKELSLSEHTVKNYLFHIFDKLGVSSRVELVLYAVSSSKRSRNSGAESSERELEATGGTGIASESLPGAGKRSSAKTTRAKRKS
jgi:DNA-binding NarL/FixJ family response regulator